MSKTAFHRRIVTRFKQIFAVASLSLIAAWLFAGCTAERPVGSVSTEEPLTGQALFADIAKTDGHSQVRDAALENID